MQDSVEPKVHARAHSAARLGALQEAVDRRDDRVRGERFEAFTVQLVDQLKIAFVSWVFGRADAQRVEGEVTFVVGGGRVLVFVAERDVDVDVLVTALAFTRVDVVEDGLHRLGDRAGVGAPIEVFDLFPARLELLGAHLAAEPEHRALVAFPAKSGEEAATDLKEAPADVAVFMTEQGDHRADHPRIQGIDQLLGKDGFREPRARDRRDGVDLDVALTALDGQRVGEAQQAELGHRIVRLAEVAVDACRGGGHHDAAVALLAKMGPRGVRDLEASEHMDAVHQVPVLGAHLVEAAVAEDARVVDQDVELAVRVERGLDDLVAVFDGVVVGDRLATGRLDLLDDRVCGAGAFAFAERGAAQVVDHHFSAAAGQQQRMRSTQAPAGAGDDRDSSIEA